jgi:hypothetical protein
MTAWKAFLASPDLVEVTRDTKYGVIIARDQSGAYWIAVDRPSLENISDDPDEPVIEFRPHWLIVALFGAALWLVALWCVWKFAVWAWRAI